MSLELQKIYDYIDEHIEEHVTSIQEFVRQKRISHTGEGIKKCVELVERYFKELGCQETRIEEPGVAKWGMEGDPVVVGKYDAGAEKTVLFCIMYDTMPVYHGEHELWSVPPWEARIVEMTPSYFGFDHRFTRSDDSLALWSGWWNILFLNCLARL